MTRRYDLVALGDPVLDLLLVSDELPRWDDKHLGRTARWASGGCEANAACAAAQLGLRCALLGHAGQGPTASVHRRDLSRHGVALEYLRSDDGIDGAIAVVYASTAGERAVSYVPAPGTRGGRDWQPRIAEAAARARMLYTLPYDAQALLAVASTAHQHGARLAVDVERAVLDEPGMREALCQGPDVLCFNASGFRSFSGHWGIDESSLQRALGQVRAEAIVVTLGEDGAIGLDRQGPAVRQAAWPARVVSTTGAGDAFNGAWLAGWLRGQTMGAALAQAACVAACCIESAGPRCDPGRLSALSRRLRAAADTSGAWHQPGPPLQGSVVGGRT